MARLVFLTFLVLGFVTMGTFAQSLSCEDMPICSECIKFNSVCQWCSPAGVCFNTSEKFEDGYTAAEVCESASSKLVTNCTGINETCGVAYNTCSSCIKSSACGYCVTTSGSRCFQSGFMTLCMDSDSSWNNCSAVVPTTSAMTTSTVVPTTSAMTTSTSSTSTAGNAIRLEGISPISILILGFLMFVAFTPGRTVSPTA